MQCVLGVKGLDKRSMFWRETDASELRVTWVFCEQNCALLVLTLRRSEETIVTEVGLTQISET